MSVKPSYEELAELVDRLQLQNAELREEIDDLRQKGNAVSVCTGFFLYCYNV